MISPLLLRSSRWLISLLTPTTVALVRRRGLDTTRYGRRARERLSGADAEHDAIAWDSDLAPLSMLTEIPQYQKLCDGAPISEVFEDLDDEVLAERGVPGGLDSGEGCCCYRRGGSPTSARVRGIWSACRSPPTASNCRGSQRRWTAIWERR